MSKVVRIAKKHAKILMMSLPILSFVIPLIILYYLYPETFEMTWQGRTYYMFFLWLMLLETIMNWERLQPARWKLRSARTLLFATLLSLPTIYVIACNYYGLNGALESLAMRNNILFSNLMPLSVEYLVFTVLFVSIAFATYGIANLRNYSLTALFLGAIGAIYTINNLYPWGLFTPFQVLVPTTTMLAAGILNFMGYNTSIGFVQSVSEGSMPTLTVFPSHAASVTYKIAWPCSGIDSLLIFSITILLFLGNSAIPWKQRTVYFIVGAVITYFINALRIATIFTIAVGGGNIDVFHNYYGPLYSMTWIIFYPLLIIGGRTLWGKIATRRSPLNQNSSLSSPRVVSR